MAEGTERVSVPLTPLRLALAVAAIVFGLGFGIMNLFWFSRDWPLPEGRGLYYFKSATWGDGLVLPLLAFALTRIGRWTQSWTTRQLRVTVAVAVIFGLVGAGSQAQWLLDPDTALNWTIPEPGQFNAAGWYHAAFLTLAMALFGALMARAVLQTWQVRSDPRHLRTPEYSLTLVLLPLFPALNSLDFFSADEGVETFLAQVTPWLLVPAVLVLVFAAKVWRSFILPLVLAWGTSLALPAMIVFSPDQSASTRAAWLAVALFAPNFSSPFWRSAGQLRTLTAGLSNGVWALAIGVLVHDVLVPDRAIWAHAAAAVLVGLVVAPLTLLALAPLRWHRRRVRAELLLNSLAMPFVVAFGTWVALRSSPLASEGLFVLWSVTILSAISYEKYLFRQYVKAERVSKRLRDATPDAGGSTESRGRLKAANRRTRTHRIRVYSWGVLTFITVVINIGIGEAALARQGPPVMSPASLATALSSNTATLALVLIAVTVAWAGLRRPVPSATRWMLLVLVAGSLVLSTAASRAVFHFLQAPERTGLLMATVILPTTGAILFIALSVLSNVGILRGRRLDRRLAGVAIMAALLVASVLPSIAVLLATGPGLLHRAVAVATALTLMLLPLLLVECLLDDDLSRTRLADTEPRFGLVQDAILTVLLSTTVIGYPLYSLLAHESLETVIVRSVSVLGVVACLYGWILMNNIEHARGYAVDGPRRSELLEGVDYPVSRADFHRRIRFHTRAQNTISALMILPVVPYLLTSLDVEEIGFALIGDGHDLATDGEDSFR